MIKAQVERDVLFPLLNQAQGILDRKISSPLQSAVLLEAAADGSLLFKASGMELSFSGSVSCKVEEAGSVAVNGKKLFDILRETPSGPIALEEGENYKIEIKTVGASFHVLGINPEDFPVFPPVSVSKFQKISISSFLDAVDKTLYCVSLDESRYHLTGVYCQCYSKLFQYRFASTDGHRMACFDLFLEDFTPFRKGEGEGVILPKKGLQEIKRMLSAADEEDEFFEFFVEESRAAVRLKNQTLFIRLIEGSFPDYGKLIPKKKGVSVIVDREDFISALKKVFVLTNDRYKAVNISFKSGKAVLNVIVPEEADGSSVVDCSYKKKDELLIRFNCRYLIEAMQAVRESKVQFYVRGKEDGLMILGHGNKSYLSVIMPMSFPKNEASDLSSDDDEDNLENNSENNSDAAPAAPPSMEGSGI